MLDYVPVTDTFEPFVLDFSRATFKPVEMVLGWTFEAENHMEREEEVVVIEIRDLRLSPKPK